MAYKTHNKNAPKPRKNKTLVLLDAHALIHRSFHALPALTGADGEPIGAVYGVAMVLLKLIRELKPDYMAAAFDLPEPTFRHIVYEEYKANRPKAPEGLINQFNKARELIAAFGITALDAPGFEADDILGTLVKRFYGTKNLDIIITSGDLDTLQLVKGNKVRVYTLKKGIQDTVFYNEQAVKKRYGFSPTLLPDYKGLKGDPSDNIIGVKGIGDKTATQIIQTYGGLGQFYKKLKKEKKRPDWMTERIKTKLLEGEEEALFSRELALIRTDAPITVNLNGLLWKFPKERVLNIFQKNHFWTLASRIEAGGKKRATETTRAPLSPKPAPVRDFTARGAQALATELKSARTLYGALDEAGALFLFVDGNVPWRVSKTSIKTALSVAAENLSSSASLMGHGTKAILRLFIKYGILPPRVSFDTLIAEWALRPDARDATLANMLAEHISIESTETSGALALKQLPKVVVKLTKELKEKKLKTVYFNIELPLIPILAVMEARGILLNQKELRALESNIKKQLKETEQNIYKLAGEAFNIQSPKQLSEILFERLGIPATGMKKTPMRVVSTRGSELEKIKGANPIVAHILRYRELAKLYNTYITALPKLVASDGRLHTHFHQTGTVTGRLSSRDPNLQNIPIRTPEGEAIRRAFVSERGFVFVSFDYSQIDLRVAASLAKDEKMIAAFRAGEDIHARTAADIYNVAINKVTKEMRRRAKTINFGILYGMGRRALSELTGMSPADARLYMDEYFHAFSGITAYIASVKETARKNGFVETLYGRRRYLPGIASGQFRVAREAERMAVNTPIQGTAADIIKRAMIHISRRLNLIDKSNDVHLLLQVHDELLFEIRAARAREFIPMIRQLMEQATELDVPLIVDVKQGKNWADLKKLT